MISHKNINKIYLELINKTKYDRMNNLYYIDIFDYIKYNLTQKEIEKLKLLCQKDNILLITLPKTLTQKETEILFDKLIYLKQKLNIDSNNIDKEQIKKEINDLRTKLFLGHQLLIYRILSSVYPDITNSSYKEDIIQSGYIILMNAIDIFEPKKAISFRWYVYQYTSSHIKRAAFSTSEDLITQKDLLNLIEVREKYEESHKRNISLEELSRATNLTENRIKELLVLEQLINIDSIENIVENEEDIIVKNQVGKDLEDKSIETIVNNIIFKELLKMIIDTLPSEKQKEVLKLHYGLDDNNPKTASEIASKLGILRQRVEQHKKDAIELLQHPTRARYLKEIIEVYTDKEYTMLKHISTNINPKDKIYEQLELFLLSKIPKKELYELIYSLNPYYHQVLLTHFSLIYQEYSYSEKVKLLEITYHTYLKIKRLGLERLRKAIQEKYSIDKSDANAYLDYLMYSYLNKSKIKTKRK